MSKYFNTIIVCCHHHCYRPHPKDGGRYCFQFVCQFTSRERGGGYPISGMGRGVPHLRSRYGGTPSQVWVGGYPISGLGGTPSQGVPYVWRGTPCWGVPHVWGGTASLGSPIAQSSIASTCYAAGGVPFAFTQEDFLVVIGVDVSCSLGAIFDISIFLKRLIVAPH